MNVLRTESGVGTINSANDSLESTLYSSMVAIQPTHLLPSVVDLRGGAGTLVGSRRRRRVVVAKTPSPRTDVSHRRAALDAPTRSETASNSKQKPRSWT